MAVFVLAGIAATLAFADGANPSFTFSTDETGATFQCSLDGASPGACSSPKAYSNLSPGQHTVTVTSTFTVPQPAAQPPTAAFSASANPVTGQPVTFDGTASTCAATPCTYRYADKANDATLGTAQTSSFTFKNTGTKFVVLTVTDAQNRTATVEHDIQVAKPAPPPPPAPVPPANTAAPSISGTPQSGSTLTASPGTWSGDTPITFAYAWSDGATGKTDALTDADVGQTVSVTVTASNDAGSATSTSSPTLPVQAAPAPPPPSGNCDLNATPSNLASQVSAATSGQTICLANGNYGTWDPQTSKAYTVTAAPGASPNLSFDLYNTSNLTIDGAHTNYDLSTSGINSTNPNWIESSSNHVTIKNMAFTCQNSTGACLETQSSSAVVIQGNIFHDMQYPNSTSGALFAWGGGGQAQTVIKNNLFENMGSDGIDGGTATIVGNDFINVNSDSTDPRHTDVIQFDSNALIEGNFVSGGCIQGIDAFDGTTGNTITDNVVATCSVHSLVTAADNPGSLVSHNTVTGAGGEECGSKTGSPPSTTKIQDNILSDGINWGGVQCTPVDGNNMSQGSFGQIHSSSDFLGTPQFVGGSNPNTYAGYALASGSPGAGKASDGSDVGARVSIYPRPAGLP